MGYNLTNERIQDTYQQILQISGSTIVDGTGSVAPVLLTSASYADFAVTASYALNVTPIDTSSLTPLSTFNAYTSSNDTAVTSLSSSTSASIATINNQIASLEAGSGSADWPLITNKPSGLVSGSAQTIKHISGSAITPASVNTPALVATTFIGGNGSFGTVGFNTLSTTNLTASNALVNNDLIVNGTASFGYLQSVTGSAKIIGDAFIILNADSPASRYAGVKVYDSGSSPVSTGSLQWDSVNNDWFYEYQKDATDYAVVLFGPEYSTKGTPDYPASNVIQKGTGGHHLTGSIMSDNGSQVLVQGSVSASTYYGDGSNLDNIPATLANGSGGANSIRTINVTNTDAQANGARSIAFGDSVVVAGTDAIGIGADQNTAGTRTITIGYGADTVNQYGIAIGNVANGSGDSAIAIGYNAGATNSRATAVGVDTIANGLWATALGQNAAAGGANAVAVGGCSANGTNAVAVGDGAVASSTNTQAIGVSANASGNESVAVGTSANSSNNDTVMVGTRGTANAIYSVAIGGFAETTGSGNGNIALGNRSKANHDGSVAIGYQVETSADNEININNRFKFDGSSVMTLSGSIVSASANLEVAGQLYSPTFAGSVASSTSSIDFDNGNFATLSLSAATFLANPSNLKSGTTYTLLITSGSQVSNYGTSWKFAGGTQPTLSDGTDVLTCVSDGTNLYATALANFS